MPSKNDIEYNNNKREIKRIPHPKKVKKGEEKMILNYRLEEVCGYGKNNLESYLIVFIILILIQ